MKEYLQKGLKMRRNAAKRKVQVQVHNPELQTGVSWVWYVKQLLA